MSRHVTCDRHRRPRGAGAGRGADAAQRRRRGRRAARGRPGGRGDPPSATRSATSTSRARRPRSGLRPRCARCARDGVEAYGEVGDPDPVQAAQDALLKAPADEILIFEHEEAQARWFESGLFEARPGRLEPPLRMVVFATTSARRSDVVEVEESGRGHRRPATHEQEVGSAYLPGLSRARLRRDGPRRRRHDRRDRPRRGGRRRRRAPRAAGRPSRSGSRSRIALINMAHVVGLTLFETRPLPRRLRQVLPHPLLGRDPARGAREPADPALRLSAAERRSPRGRRLAPRCAAPRAPPRPAASRPRGAAAWR